MGCQNPKFWISFMKVALHENQSKTIKNLSVRNKLTSPNKTIYLNKKKQYLISLKIKTTKKKHTQPISIYYFKLIDPQKRSFNQKYLRV